ncbi:microviridin/marinostatin family tricyclic proteinase inhibitor [Microscilla marina]|uniref:Conserved domain protein n=1 Tax=Microscilla marina ATCC 23134 TaxID=313606 RepID=A1ZXI2_MICM2|nr:microviridin/marinostatin family tricyclic proteinase inhibitor [Microscilla marina]EAY24950.1 conserved domain protein [Microscilla marina ATCC 23134]
MKKNVKKPFFAKFLENQVKEESLTNAKGGTCIQTRKYPSDSDEYVTMKYPSDNDEF